MEIKSTVVMFGGKVQKCTHESEATKTPMVFSIFLPPQAAVEGATVPVLFFLSGLTCTDDNFTQKACAQRAAAEHGIALVAPDTSPRGAGVAGEDDGWDFGTGAGFYVDATAEPFAANYNMYSYVTEELPALIGANFPAVDVSRMGVTGHSMGGHGALTIALKNPTKYRSVSAFSPICHPTACPWGTKAFTGYLGSVEAGAAHDATELMKSAGPFPSLDILIDQGGADSFLTGDVDQLLPDHFEEACKEKGQQLTLRVQAGYDHSYFFIASFVDEHVAHHAKALNVSAL